MLSKQQYNTYVPDEYTNFDSECVIKVINPDANYKYVTYITCVITLPDLPHNCRWIQHIGSNLIKKAELFEQEKIISTTTSNLIHIYNHLYYGSSEVQNYYDMIGHVPEMHTMYGSKKRCLYVPLFCFNDGIMIENMSVKIKLDKLDNLIEIKSGSTIPDISLGEYKIHVEFHKTTKSNNNTYQKLSCLFENSKIYDNNQKYLLNCYGETDEIFWVITNDTDSPYISTDQIRPSHNRYDYKSYVDEVMIKESGHWILDDVQPGNWFTSHNQFKYQIGRLLNVYSHVFSDEPVKLNNKFMLELKLNELDENSTISCYAIGSGKMNYYSKYDVHKYDVLDQDNSLYDVHKYDVLDQDNSLRNLCCLAFVSFVVCPVTAYYLISLM